MNLQTLAEGEPHDAILLTDCHFKGEAPGFATQAA